MSAAAKATSIGAAWWAKEKFVWRETTYALRRPERGGRLAAGGAVLDPAAGTIPCQPQENQTPQETKTKAVVDVREAGLRLQDVHT